MSENAPQFEPISPPPRPEFVEFVMSAREAIIRATGIPPALLRSMPIPDEKQFVDGMVERIWNDREPPRLTFSPKSA